MPSGGVPFGPRSVSLAGCSLHASSILYGLLCFVYPCGECPARPVSQDTPSVGPFCPDPEVDISTSRLHLRHGVRLETSHPLLLSREDVLDLRCLCHLAVPTFHLLGIPVGFPKSKRGYIGVAPATWGSAEDLTPSFCLWGTPWLCIPPDSGRNPSESVKRGPAGMECWGI